MGTLSTVIRKGERWLLIVLMILLTIFCFMQVFWRLALKDPLSWTEELCRYIYVWITFIGAAVAVAESGHFRVDAIFAVLPPKAVKALHWFTYLCIIVFAVAMVGPGWPLISKVGRQISPALQISMSIPYCIIPISGVLMLFHVAELIVAEVRSACGGTREEPQC